MVIDKINKIFDEAKDDKEEFEDDPREKVYSRVFEQNMDFMFKHQNINLKSSLNIAYNILNCLKSLIIKFRYKRTKSEFNDKIEMI